MATGAWQVGWNKSISIFGVLLKILTSSWDEQIEALDVTHSQSGGVEGWIPGVLRGEGAVTCNIDAALVPPAFSLVAGAFGYYIFYIGSNTPFSNPIGITKVHYTSAVLGKVEYSFDVKMNSEVGPYVRAG